MAKEVISIEYSVKDADTQQQVDTNIGKEPLEFITGNDMIIPGLENAIKDLKVGVKIDVTVSPEDAYGKINKEAIQILPKEQFAGVELVEGMSLYGTGEDNQTVQVTVKTFDDENVTIDYNHPLAGKTLLFAVKILNSRDLTDEEIQTGVIGGLAVGVGCGCGVGGCETSKSKHKHEEAECCKSENC
jgi:FKBP-type peptidyl-prolyl cis-trans isomerase SlyD